MTVDTSVSLNDRIHELISSGEFELPPLPDLALRIQTALQDDSADARQIAEWIRSEPATAAALLRTANSAAFGGLRPISELSQAIARLGLKQVQTLVTAVLVQGQFETKQGMSRKTLEGLWNHAVASATLAYKLAPREGYPPDDAFLAGLLHGIGRLLVLRALDHLTHADPDLAPTAAAVDELAEGLQYELGHSTLRSWNLSEDICDAARALDPDGDIPDKPITRIVQAADLVAKKIGMHPHPDPDLDLMDQDAIDALDLGDVELAALLVDLEDEIAELKTAFRSG